jgi:hypothetical protein
MRKSLKDDTQTQQQAVFILKSSLIVERPQTKINYLTIIFPESVKKKTAFVNLLIFECVF